MANRSTLYDTFTKTVQHFKLEELKDCVVPDIPNASWERIQEKILLKQLLFSLSSINKYLLKKCKNLSNPELQDLIHNLQIIDIAHHSGRRKWRSFEIIRIRDELSSSINLDSKLIQAVRLQGLDCVVKQMDYDDIVWIMFVEKKLSPFRYTKPVYCAHILQYPHLYFSASGGVIPPYIIKAMTKIFHCRSIKQLKLFGPSIKSLHDLLERGEAQSSDAESTEFNPVEFRESERGTDFTQNEDRHRYAVKTLGEDPPLLGEFVFNHVGPWKGTDAVPEMAGEMVSFQFKMKSKNVLKSIQDMSKKGILKTPFLRNLCESNLPFLTRNDVTHKANGN